MLYVRRSIWELEQKDPWDDYTVAYAKAVAVMRKRDDLDPTSWTYQAAMHGTWTTPPPGVTWNQCQHGSWFFLPWHRMYCYWFEQIVRDIVLVQDGPDDWALPFWNYSLGPPYDTLPPAFREPTWDPGTGPEPNPLYTTHRDPSYNNGASLPANLVNLDALNAQNFSGPPLPGFGGPVTGFSHEPQRFGRLENVPHNQVHVQIGGEENDPCQGGWMVDPNCAAEDPIFWLHHSNIDRLWSEWIGLGGTRANPTDPAWLSGQSFTFFDTQGTAVVMTAQEVLDTATQLDYTYESQPPAVGARAEVTMSQPPPSAAPRLVAASENGVALGRERADVRVPMEQPARDALRAVADPADQSAQHVYLNVEGLEADRTPGVSWEVHLNLPDDAPAGPGDHFVGLISFFGFRDQLDPGADHTGLGPMAHTFDITDLVAGLRDRGQWDDLAAMVSFVPVGPGVERMTARPRVGRVSITYH